MLATRKKLRNQHAKWQSPTKQLNKNLYDHAESLYYDGMIKASVLHTLKAIIACRQMKWPTIKQINETRTRSAYTKFAQADRVSSRTIQRHIDLLVKLNIIKRKTFYYSWGQRCEYGLGEGLQKLVATHGDNVYTSISSSSLSEKRSSSTSLRSCSAQTEINNHTEALGLWAACLTPPPCDEKEEKEDLELKRQRDYIDSIGLDGSKVDMALIRRKMSLPLRENDAAILAALDAF